MPKLCEKCGERPATVPDRNRMGRPINRVCSECHAGFLREDLLRVMAQHRARHTPAKHPFACRPAVERELERLANPTGMQLNDGKVRVTLPAGTLEYMLAIIDHQADEIARLQGT